MNTSAGAQQHQQQQSGNDLHPHGTTSNKHLSPDYHSPKSKAALLNKELEVGKSLVRDKRVEKTTLLPSPVCWSVLIIASLLECSYHRQFAGVFLSSPVCWSVLNKNKEILHSFAVSLEIKT